MPPDEDAPPPQIKPYAQLIQEQRGGGLHGELSERVQEAVRAALETRKKSSVTVTISFAPNKDGVTLTVTDDVKTKIPQGDRGAAIFFADEHGNLSRSDPRQTELPLREVRGGRADEQPLREVN